MSHQGNPQRYRWLPWLLVMVLVGNVAAAALLLRYFETRLRTDMGQTLTLMAVDIVDKLDRLLFERHSDIRIFAHILASHTHDLKAQTSYLNMVKDTYLYYRWIGVTDARGRIIAATDQASVGGDRSQSPWFQTVRDHGSILFHSVTVFQDAGQARTTGFSAPITGPSGEFLGVLTALVRLSELEDVAARTIQAYKSQLPELTGGMGIEWNFLTQDGALISDSVLRQEGTVNLQTVAQPSVKLAATGGPGFVEEAHGRLPYAVLTGYARTKGYGEYQGAKWLVLVRMDENLLLLPIASMQRTLGLVGGLALVPTVGLLLWSTRRLRTEWARVQEKHRDLLHSLDAIVWEGDPTDFRITYISPQVDRILGYAPEQCVSQQVTWQDLIHPEDLDQVVAACQAGILAGASHDLEYRMRRADGRVIWVKDLVTVVMDRERPVRLHGVIVDITKQKENERTEAMSRTQLANIIGSAMDAIVVVDEDQRICIFNAAAVEVFRCPAGDAIGQPLDRFIPERFRARHGAHFNGLANAPSPAPIKQPGRMLTGLRADGEEFPADIALSSVETPNGWRYTAIVRDMADKVRADRRLRAQYAVTQILAEAMTLQEATKPVLEALCDCLEWSVGAYWSVDAQSQTLQCVEIWHRPGFPVAAFETITRQSTWAPGVGLLGRIWSTGQPMWVADVEHDHSLPQSKVAVAANLHGAVGVPILHGRTVLGVLEFFSERIAAPDQSLLQMLAAIGKQIGLFVGRRQAQATAGTLLQAIESLDEGVILADLHGVITYTNPAARGMFGYEGEDLIGRSARALYYDENSRVERFSEILASAQHSHWSGEVTGLRKNGTRFPRWVSVSLTRDHEGHPQGLVSVSRDLTETKQMEAQAWRLERLATLGQLLGGIAHELKNPLFILTGRIQLLEEKLNRKEYGSVGTDLQKIDAAAQRMTVVAERFLSLARPVPPRVERCSVPAILQEVLEFLGNELMKNQIRVERAGPSELPAVRSDPNQLHEVFLNLMLNAIQAMVGAHGRGTLRVATALVQTAPHDEERQETREWIEVRIQDDGPGIAPEHRAKLFEPFFSTKPPGKGTGLGLWAARSILATFGGDATFETEVDQGTTFIVRLPVTAQSAHQETGTDR